MAVTGESLLPGRYTGAQRIGRGGMGEVFRATDTALGRAVAIKVLDVGYAERDDVRERFMREALAVARLSWHPNVVTIYDVGEYRGRPYIVMEYVGGGSLEQQLEAEGAQPPARALAWLEEAADALDAAHDEGVVHRDVKPANLLLGWDGRVRVADFGVAAVAGPSSLSEGGTLLGRASYLAPEQVQGRRATAASDLYALAIVAFELLTGSRPFEADDPNAEAMAHVAAELPSVCELNRDVPCELDSVFATAMAKDPDARYGSCGELVAALRRAYDRAPGRTQPIALPARGHAAAARADPLEPPMRRRPRWLLPLLGLLTLGLIGAGIALVFRGGGTTASAPPPLRVTTRVRTVTQRLRTVATVTGPTRTVVTTVFTTAPAPTPTPTRSAGAPPAVGGNPYDENNRAYALMRAGDYRAALPLLQDAVARLRGRRDLGTAYAAGVAAAPARGRRGDQASRKLLTPVSGLLEGEHESRRAGG